MSRPGIRLRQARIYLLAQDDELLEAEEKAASGCNPRFTVEEIDAAKKLRADMKGKKIT